MKILVLYKLSYAPVRKSALAHLYSLQRYSQDIRFHYFNAIRGVPRYLSAVKYDGVILHYTFLAKRYHVSKESWKKFIGEIKNLKGYKIAIPQDEYDETNKLCTLFKLHNIETVFTCFDRKEDYLKAYSSDPTRLKHYIPILTGYIDEQEVKKLEKHCLPYKDKPIDIGYRATKMSYLFGRHSQFKHQLAEIFLLKLRNTNFIYDIAITGDIQKVILGNDWYKFLLKCKATLGCEGGSSLLDATGEIRKKVLEFVKLHPDATFEETERACFPGKDYNIRCFAISPRHFEAAMTKTLQVLVEGNYNGIFKPYEHYIPIRKDFSNIDEVLELLKDNEYCQKIIDKAYNDIVLSGKYTYRTFANLVIDHIRKHKNTSISTSKRDEAIFLLVGIYTRVRNIILDIIIKMFYYGVVEPLKIMGVLYKIKKNPMLYSIAKKLINTF